MKKIMVITLLLTASNSTLLGTFAQAQINRLNADKIKKEVTLDKKVIEHQQPFILEKEMDQTNSNSFRMKNSSSVLNIVKKMSVYAFYNLADDSSFEGSSNGTNFSGTISTSNSFGLGTDFKLKTTESGINVVAGLGYEFNHIFNKVQTRAGGQTQSSTLETPKPELKAWVLSLSGELPLSDEMSIFGGGNFNIPNMKNNPGTYSGKIGWQIGGTYTVAENMMVDGMWRSFNFTGADESVTFENINTSGFIVRGRMNF